MFTKEIGKLGEAIAVKYLENKGYRILDRNFSFRVAGPQKGEIDIVAKKDNLISFVEVKTINQKILQPRDFLMGSFLPERKVDFGKQKKIIKMAEFWLMKNKIHLDSKWQIDVMAVEIYSQNKKAKIRHLKNAIIS